MEIVFTCRFDYFQLLPYERVYTDLRTFDSRLLFSFGGTDGQYHYNDTWCYDTNTQIWVELSCIGYIPVPREGHAATLVDDVMYVFGGRGVDGKDLEDLAAFKITSTFVCLFFLSFSFS